MGDYTSPTKEQLALCRECDINPEGYVVILDNDRMLCMRHLKTRNEISIIKNRRVTNGNQ